MTAPKSTMVGTLRKRLERAADPVKARAQQAYMKSAMPYAGVAMPDVRDIARDVFGALRFDESTEWRQLSPLSRREALKVIDGASAR